MGFSKFVWSAVVCAAVILLFLVMRPLLHAIVRSALRVRMRPGKPLGFRDRVLLRYEGHNFYVWMFAWFKTRLDPMFSELPEMLKPLSGIRSVLDLGCGFGFAGSFLLEWFGDAEVYGVEPSAVRVNGAARAWGDRGHACQGAAPDFEVPSLPSRFDAAFFLDVIYFLTDSQLTLTLQRIRARLKEGDYLFLRAPMRPAGVGTMKWYIDRVYRRSTGAPSHLRSAEQICDIITKAGFDVVRSHLSGTNAELFWFISTASVPARNRDGVMQPMSAAAQHNGQDHE